jgi:hypothetical protein
MYFCSELQICIALGAILVICTLTCYINEKLCIFVYKWFGFILMHMNIYVFFQNLNILCSFWSSWRRFRRFQILDLGFIAYFECRLKVKMISCLGDSSDLVVVLHLVRDFIIIWEVTPF